MNVEINEKITFGKNLDSGSPNPRISVKSVSTQTVALIFYPLFTSSISSY